jgi:hypothetical protein
VLIDVLQVSDTRVQYILPSQAREILELWLICLLSPY